MKKIGLIGGVGPESSIEYYRLIIKRFQDKLATKNYPDLIINSINMTEMLGYISNNQLDKVIDFLVDRIHILEKAGVDCAAIASNTPHIVFDRIAKRINIPLISIVEETCKVVNAEKLQRVGLFGTKFTMTNGFYDKVAEKYGIDMIIPTMEYQNFIHDKYMTELLFNNVVPETKKQFLKIVKELQKKESIEGLILGGTELPLILKQADFEGIKIFDTTKIHVESIVSKMIER